MHEKTKGKVIGLGKSIRNKTIQGRKKAALWKELHHEKRTGLRRLLLLTTNKEHHLGGRIQIVNGIHKVASLQFHEYPTTVPKQTVFIIRLVKVAPKYQGEQTTPEMIKQVIQLARNMKRVKSIELTVDSDNKRAHLIYEKMGFVEYERQPHPERKEVDIISMELKIKP